MKYYIGIDLGTTNSAISTFDGKEVRIHKTKAQSDVTPSNIFIDKKGKRFYGQKAYEALKGPNSDRVAKKFKRYMGTGTNIEFADISMTPVECSAEILRELMRCLPEEIAQSDDKATIITVPAAFDQRQNAATEEAAKLANIGKVALMQEPVAAIMRVVKSTQKNGSFIIFDMGGGTLDVAIATYFNGKVDVIAHGGIAMCGGADIDRLMVNEIVIPWIQDNYDVPSNFRGIEKYEKGLKIAAYLAEDAKIELSSSDTASIYGSLRISDESDEEIELDIPIDRSDLDPLIEDLEKEAIQATRDTIKKSGMSVDDFDRAVFIGGPCNYKPLRDRVCRELGLKSDGLEVNPMTAVSEGAAIFAESIDWTTKEHFRKSSHSEAITSEELGLNFKLEARTTYDTAKVGVKLKANVSGYTFEIKSTDTGWASGSLDLINGSMLKVPVEKLGENTFEIFVFDDNNRPVKLQNNHIVITRTAATVGAILASHTLGVEVSDSAFDDSTSLDYIVREGDKLPVKGRKTFKAKETIKSGTNQALIINVWQGEISTDVRLNQFMGTMKIEGTDLEYGSIRAGDEFYFDYNIDEAGALNVDVTFPKLDISFNSGKNFYAHEDGQVDMNSVDTIKKISAEGEAILDTADEYGDKIHDERLYQVEELANNAKNLIDTSIVDPEEVKKNHDNLAKARKILDDIRKDNLALMRRSEMEEVQGYYDKQVAQFASAVEKQEFRNLFALANSIIERNDGQFEQVIDNIRGKCTVLLFKKSDKYITGMFQYYRARSYLFSNTRKFKQLVDEGTAAIQNGDYDTLRKVIALLFRIMDSGSGDNTASALANIMRG